LDSNTSSPRNTTLTRQAALPLRWKSTLLLIVVSLAGLAMFLWPLFTSADPADFQHALDAPFVFAALIPLLIVLVLAQLAEGGLDVKALALLGVLSAVNAVLRPLGAGVGGIETVGFLLIVAGRVFGPGFGFALGCTSLFASALLTAGVGPWLPYQMLSCAWIGLGAGLLPDRLCGRAVRGWAETALLAFYGIAAAYGFGFLMNMWFWPFAAGASGGALAYIPGGALLDNLHRFVSFTLVTSTALWDTGRAITDLVAVLVLGRPVLGLLRRASRKASFDAVADFTP
jgi:energy-coupling factor transport system substrate-specific component